MDECLEKLNGDGELKKISIKPNNRRLPEPRTSRKRKNNNNKLILFARKLLYYKPFMHILDVAFSLLLITPCVVAFWRGTWILMDIYVKIFPYWPSIFFSCAILCSFYILKEVQMKTKTNRARKSIDKTLAKKLLLRLYTYFFAWMDIMSWRGFWAFLDMLGDAEYQTYGSVIRTERTYVLLAASAGSLLGLLMLRSSRNSLAPPMVITLDNQTATFFFPTRFRVGVCTYLFFRERGGFFGGSRICAMVD